MDFKGRLGIGVLVSLTCVPSLGRGAERYAVKVERGVAVKMRDGVVMRADIYRPESDGKIPGSAPAHTLQQGGRIGVRL